ncbi:MAG: ribosome small subunit-dependent GTPase A [Actinobacteria bacterium 13_1_40CM_2_65_8]|nr:MAG: ribosome small subunit-dependent GTPase A [Actinobacteria bacterium 13_1_40CM_4_65_12]OLD48937.1 MAG: ribosome small subunit-dependent GTPase A [Actinobacteria bacterium 13_1_40CM_2_65_8]
MPLHFGSQLAVLGWDEWFQERFALFANQGYAPARVIADFGAEYLLHDGDEALRAAAGRHLRNDGAQLPAVGDWVAMHHRDPISTIHGWVERKTAFSRKVAWVESKEQVLAANVDVAFVVASAQDVNARRIERYLTMAWQSGAVPVVVLTKADIADSPDDLRTELESAAAGTPVLVTSAVTGEGVDALVEQLRPARTGVLLGPSGAGKSTLINRMAGTELMKTRSVHRSGEGRHMTSHRQLFQVPRGGMIIDTPGLREAQLWKGEEALGNLFEDIEQIAQGCRFNDCEHRSEPGCAINAAIARGELDGARLENYRKLQRELRAVAARSDARLRTEERRKWKQIAVDNKVRERLLRK